MATNKKMLAGLLALGASLLVLSQVRFGVGLLGWVAPVPFLVFLHRTSGWRSRILFTGTLCVAWTLAATKYITPPLPSVLILLNGVTFGVVSAIGWLTWSRLQKGLPSFLSSLAFAAIMVTIEWLQYSFTPLATNGSVAYTQLENLPFLQMASLFGVVGIAFLMYWFAAVVARSIVEGKIPRRQAAVVIGLVILVHVWGSIRIGSSPEGPTVNVATVGTDSTWFGEALPDAAKSQEIQDALFARTEEASADGAKLIVWNEVSTFVDPDQEPAFIGRGAAIARSHNVHIALSYLLLVNKEPMRVENKYTWVGPDGSVLDTYLKHKPVPGEPSIPGDGNARVIATDYGRMGGAICYDMDFPQVGLRLARQQADIVFVPSSDTPGVDPFHTQIAAVRAIEGGYSVVRSTRMGLSGAIDPYGRIRGWLSSNETDQRVLHSTIPHSRAWTLYSVIGDLLAYLCLAFLLGLVAWKFARKPE